MGRSVLRRKNVKARKINQPKKLSTVSSASTVKEGGKSDVSEIPIELDIDQSKYDAANPLILPSKKSSGHKGETDSAGPSKKRPKKILSLKKQKKLKKVLERKQKIQDRSKILEELSKHQLDSQTYNALSSTSNLHTRGLKRGIEDVYNAQVTCEPNEPGKIRTVGKRKRRNLNSLDVKGDKLDDNVLGFEKSDDEEEEEEEAEEEAEIAPENTDELTESVGKSIQTELVNETDLSESKKISENDQQLKVQDEKSVNGEKDDSEKQVSEKKDVGNSSDNQSPEDSTKTTDETKVPANNEQKQTKKRSNYVDMATKFVPVNRDPEIEAARAKLPIVSEEQDIMEKIRYNDVIILSGETGSGKTTQIPQFLYEAGYAIDRKIGITEPRRVAAISMSSRVAREMNLSNEIVSYQIRFEGNVSDQTKIKFMTDGILLKEIQKDLLLSSYSAIIIDEAHERTVYSDILIGLLSRIVRLRSKKRDPLKLIIMSATLQVNDFKENVNLFKPKPPLVKIKSRQFPVAVHFSKITPDDYLSEAYNKVRQIHLSKPKTGGILVFLTGQQEVITLCNRLRRAFPFNENSIAQQKEKERNLEEKKLSRKEVKKLRRIKPQTLADISTAIDLDAYGEDIDLNDDISDDEEIGPNELKDKMDDNTVSCDNPLYVLPLFSRLNEKRQKKIFENPPEGVRLCVVSTNIAETSLTIPNIKYVVDTGKVKMKYYDQTTGISTFHIGWTSQASADQRSGRSGRMGPGDCYRLYTSAKFTDEFQKFSDPEIVRKPVDDLVLQMKSMNIDNVINFPFVTRPDPEKIIAAEKCLVHLGALKPTEIIKANVNQRCKRPKVLTIRRITPLGKVLSYFPLSPRYAKMLILASQHNLIDYGVTVVSCLSVQEMFLSSTLGLEIADDGQHLSKVKLVRSHNMKRLRKKFTEEMSRLGDLMIFLCAVGAWEFELSRSGCTASLCNNLGLQLKAMNEIRKLRQQLRKEIVSIFPQLEFPVDFQMNYPTDSQAKCLRQIALSGLFDHIARLIPEDEKKDEDRKKLRKAYTSVQLDLPVFIGTDSSLHDLSPEWVVYNEIYEPERSQKHFMRYVVAIEPEWIPIYAPMMCVFSSKPLEKPEPRYDPVADCIKCTVTCNVKPHNWPLPDTEIEYPGDSDAKYRWFARFLLEGQILDYFATKRSEIKFLSEPKLLQASYSAILKRTQSILISLVSKKITSKQALIKMWKQDPKFLLNDYLEWIPEAHHDQIRSEWPPIPAIASDDSN